MSIPLSKPAPVVRFVVQSAAIPELWAAPLVVTSNFRTAAPGVQSRICRDYDSGTSGTPLAVMSNFRFRPAAAASRCRARPGVQSRISICRDCDSGTSGTHLVATSNFRTDALAHPRRLFLGDASAPRLPFPGDGWMEGSNGGVGHPSAPRSEVLFSIVRPSIRTAVRVWLRHDGP